MATKRVTHTFRKGDILEVKEYHDGRYGARGLPREKKRKPTPEQMAVVNAMNISTHILTKRMTSGSGTFEGLHPPVCKRMATLHYFTSGYHYIYP